MLPEPITHLLKSRLGIVLVVACALLCGAFTTSAHAADNDYCATGSTTTYDGPDNGTWGTAGSTTNWSGGLPDDDCQAVIPSGDTVTLTTTPGPGSEGTFAGGSAQGLTIDGGATLIVAGVSTQGEQGNVANNTGLTFGSYGLTIQSGGTLDIEATNNISPFTGDASGETAGGSASVITDGDSTSAITNAGTINASSSSSSYNDTLQWNTQLTNTGTINIQSGALTDLGANYPQILTNTGTINVSSGATWASSAGEGSSVTNSTGTVNNSGTATMTGSMFWIQDGGTETGNPIQLQGGETLQDSSGAGAFEFDGLCATGGLTGTIPANQTISVVGVTTNCSGNEAQTAALYLGGNSSAPVTNDGTLVLDAPGSGTSWTTTARSSRRSPTPATATNCSTRWTTSPGAW
jgi:hypothetical protein